MRLVHVRYWPRFKGSVGGRWAGSWGKKRQILCLNAMPQPLSQQLGPQAQTVSCSVLTSGGRVSHFEPLIV